MKSTDRIARKNTVVTFQRSSVTSDRYRNRVHDWTDYYTCSAYANTYTAEENGDEVTYEERSVSFEARWCPELAAVNSISYRIIFNGEAYNIRSIEPGNYQNREIRFLCRREKRRVLP